MRSITVKRRAAFTVLIAMLLASFFAIPAGAAKKAKAAGLFANPNQVAEITDATLTGALADRHCENYAWAAVVEKMLLAQKVKLGRKGWVARSSAGDRCLDQGYDYGEFARLVAGDYVLDNGRKVHIAAEFDAGPPLGIDGIIASLKRREPVLLVWRNHPMLLYGMVYDEYIGAGGLRRFEARELRLVDPFVAAGKPEQKVKFVAGKDDANEINGFMMVAVTDRQ